ncbi:MAG TPA: hypothetical protein VMX38_11400 [Verrucomicrobiae bacterium]|nr:hypothetical protein [Verrucomicrobiae bacterium]
MKAEVSKGIEELKHQFNSSAFTVAEDNQGGAYVIIERVSLGPRYAPDHTWLGFQIPALYPYADIYPTFIGADVRRVDGVAFRPPVTPEHSFQGRPAIQISRRNGAAQTASQKVTAKILKILDFLEKLP